MPTIRANSPRLTFHHGIPSNRSRKLLVQFHRNSPRIQPAKFFAVFFLVLIAKTSRHIHIQVIDHPNLIADMNRPKFLILHLNHLRNNLARRRRRFLHFVQLIFHTSNRDAVILAGIDLFHSPRIVHQVPIKRPAIINFCRGPELRRSAQIHKPAIRLLDACGNGVESKFIGPRRNTEFPLPQFT